MAPFAPTRRPRLGPSPARSAPGCSAHLGRVRPL